MSTLHSFPEPGAAEPAAAAAAAPAAAAAAAAAVPAWRAAPAAPAGANAAPKAPEPDAHVEQLLAAKHPAWLIAYMRDLTRTLAPAVKSMNVEAHPYFVGRAFTVSGPDIYLSALEGIPPGAVYVQGGCSQRDAVFSPGWTHAYVAPRGGVAVVVDGGVYKSFECGSAAVPMFAAFATPSIAINRRHGRCGENVVCAGTVVGNGDIVLGDADGVVVIPRACEDELFAKMPESMAAACSARWRRAAHQGRSSRRHVRAQVRES